MNNMQKVSDLQLLVAAFKRVRLETACAGNDNVVVSALTSSQQTHLELLSKQLAQDKYRGASLKLLTPESQEKPPLAVFSERDRVVHTAIATVVQPILEQSFTEASWGYIPEHNYLEAVTSITEYREQGFKWLITASMHDVINNVCQKTLLKLLLEVIPDLLFVDFIDRCLFDKQIENKQMMFGYKVGFGMPQDSPLTALLVHLYLNQFDKNCLAAKLAFVRYAEGFVIMAHSRKEAQKARTIAEQKLTVQQLELNKESTNIVNFEQGFEFWGYRFIGDSVIEQQAKQSCKLKTLYLTQAGYMINLVGQTLIVSQNQQKLGQVPLAMLDLIVIMTRCQLHMDIYFYCLRHQIPVVFCDPVGGLYGVLDNFGLCQQATVTKQVECQALDKSLPMANAIIDAKLHNSMAVLKRLCPANLKPLNELLAAYVKETIDAQNQLKATKTLEQVREIETLMTASYFEFWGIFLPKHWGFKGRLRCSPKDLINALLNLGYTLLFNNIHALVKGRGLSELLGVLHKGDSKPNLVFDLAEIFRSVIVDTIVLESLLKGLFSANDYTQHNGHCVLNDNGRNRFIKLFEEQMQAQLLHPTLDVLTDMRSLIDWQICQYKEAICDNGNSFNTMKL